jgi:hypothetical protein
VTDVELGVAAEETPTPRLLEHTPQAIATGIDGRRLRRAPPRFALPAWGLRHAEG